MTGFLDIFLDVILTVLFLLGMLYLGLILGNATFKLQTRIQDRRIEKKSTIKK